MGKRGFGDKIVGMNTRVILKEAQNFSVLTRTCTLAILSNFDPPQLLQPFWGI
ncbi:hypothetical protein AVDCRST_MAG92-2363 [uncultured Coleofasciculus sp.]|uniref:Uncharacterized protein n=1 Tax=uncultured Coleofasciculus sp. TaxID=1267456 RepID=A0A6J4ISD1_9CYAN|nr:hypothetical protein AVDCRST_MAG92-2363 [uncultured Coleofasciculus sp.]